MNMEEMQILKPQKLKLLLALLWDIVSSLRIAYQLHLVTKNIQSILQRTLNLSDGVS